MLDRRIGFIGTGNMGGAMIKALLNAGVKNIIASNKSGNNGFGVEVTTDNRYTASNSDIVVLAVKPQDMGSVLAEVGSNLRDKLTVSVAAGLDLNYFAKRVGGERVARVMSNLGYKIGQAASAYCLGKGCTEQDSQDLRCILESGGIAEEVDESMMDLVTGLSGSGSAYFFLMFKALEDAAVERGMERNKARRLITQTAKGSAEFVSDGRDLEMSVLAVKSKGGTTERGLAKLEEYKFIEGIASAVYAGTDRAGELRKILSGAVV